MERDLDTQRKRSGKEGETGLEFSKKKKEKEKRKKKCKDAYAKKKHFAPNSEPGQFEKLDLAIPLRTSTRWHTPFPCTAPV